MLTEYKQPCDYLTMRAIQTSALTHSENTGITMDSVFGDFNTTTGYPSFPNTNVDLGYTYPDMNIQSIQNIQNAPNVPNTNSEVNQTSQSHPISPKPTAPEPKPARFAITKIRSASGSRVSKRTTRSSR